jgi:hypothetical protein
MYDKIANEICKFIKENEEPPKAIYLGNEEFHNLRNTKEYAWQHRCGDDPTLHGYPIILVYQNNYFRVC